MNAETLVQRLQTIVVDNEGCLIAARNDRYACSIFSALIFATENS